MVTTDPAEMPRWFFESIAAFQPERGFETTFPVHANGREYPHQWKVTEVVRNERLAYDWRHPGIPGAAVVAWDLSKAGSATRVRVTFTGIETFPQDDPAFQRESCREGWEYFLGRLKGWVERGKP